MFRIGNGVDVHAFAKTRKLILGGVTIPHNEGLLGHSDADVAIHSLCDALLGAAALGDIGQKFPDSDPKHKDADSRLLLAEVTRMVTTRGYRITNCDVTIIAERPKLAPHIPAMRKNLAETMDVTVDQVSVKATTTEKLGAIGRCEGIAAHAVVLIESRD